MAATQLPAPLSRIETPAGTASWRALEWDTAEFGMPAARIDALEAPGAYAKARVDKRELLAIVLDECREAGIRHLSARVDTADLTTIHALEEAGFELIDGIQTFALSLNAHHAPLPSGTRLFEPGDLPEVLDIGRTAFIYDRFHADPSLSPDVADQVNENWTRNCCLGIAADAVVVAEEDGRVASYVTCRADREKDHGIIILVATAEWARGRGAARRASSAALHWFSAQGLATVEVGTQLRNIPAARLYESLGFRLTRTSLTFRKILHA
ncbi:MAG: GNAT family N-acetyltransferase [Bryobacteraceae bacterium]|nr:GNAT family N-acetyltransferase [Bryobacteraceae bacterium]